MPSINGSLHPGRNLGMRVGVVDSDSHEIGIIHKEEARGDEEG